MSFELQPTLFNELIELRPLQASDFEALYAVASDPLIWVQHPNPDRYKREVFENFFKGAMESGGAFLILDKQQGQVMGSSRFYSYDEVQSAVFIGYTFLSRAYWGGRYNPLVKQLMLNHAFRFVEKVFFHVGAGNIRSQKAMEKLGAIKLREIEVAYYGEPTRVNVEYVLRRLGAGAGLDEK